MMVFLPMTVPNSSLTTANFAISQPMPDEKPTDELPFNTVLSNLELEQIENEMKRLEGFEAATANSALFRKYFELALLNLEKDESSEKRRQNIIFEQILAKYFIEQNAFT